MHFGPTGLHWPGHWAPVVSTGRKACVSPTSRPLGWTGSRCGPGAGGPGSQFPVELGALQPQFPTQKWSTSSLLITKATFLTY